VSAALFLDWIYNVSTSKHPWDLQVPLRRSVTDADSSDPRDKLYALLGMAAQTQDRESHPLVLLPDYRKLVNEIFRDATKYLIASSQNLFLLSLSEHPEGALSIGKKKTKDWVAQLLDGMIYLPGFHSII
jgi:hypothetical protein